VTRYGLLLTAVATVTLPGLLAMTAVLAHEHVAADEGFTAGLSGAPLSVTIPVAATTTPAAVRDDVAGVEQASGVPVTVFSVATGQQAMGMRMLKLAATASLATSYQGTELVSQSGVGGSVKMISEVWHQGGGTTLVETSNDAASADAGVASTDPASGSPEGVFGVTRDLVSLLSKHYIALYWGDGSVVGRSASVVELYRADGTIAARYWLDNQTMVPLRRELFDMSGQVISEDSFARIQFGPFTLPQFAGMSTSTAQSSVPAASGWGTAASPAKFLTSLAKQGWSVPAASPGGLPLYAAASTTTASGEVVDLEYSDGLYDISLFVQRGRLASDMPGWRSVRVAGQQAFVSGHSVAWAVPGFVYTVIADAPPQTVRQMVGALSGAGSPGVLGRFGRGLSRLAQLINPFG
jgi:hypothetical protein